MSIPLDLTAPIAFFSSEWPLERRGPNTTTNGVVSPGVVDAKTTLVAAIQPISGTDLLKLPEGERQEGYIVIYSGEEIIKKDLVEWEGEKWEVIKLSSRNHDGKFYKAIARLHNARNRSL